MKNREMDEQNHRQERMIDTALDEYPLAPLPPGFVEQVMSRISAPQPVTPAPFKLQFLDVALPAFVAVFTAIVWGVGSWLAGQWYLPWLPDSPVTMEPVQQAMSQLAPWFSTSLILLAGSSVLIASLCLWLWLDRPQWLLNEW